EGRYARWQLLGLASVLDALERRKQSLDAIARGKLAKQMQTMARGVRAIAADEKANEGDRLAALEVLGRSADDRVVLARLLSPRHGVAVQSAALAALARRDDESIATLILEGWKGFSPALQTRALDLLSSRV